MEGYTKTSRKNIQQFLGLKFSKNFGKSQALHAGFARTKGDVVITMDADLQDSPDEIPELYRTDYQTRLTTLFLVGKRNGTIHFLLKTSLQNYLIGRPRKISGLSLHDFNCGLKAYRSEVVKAIEVYGEMHRYIPVLAVNAGFSNIVEKIVIHQARKYGKTKFGMERFINGFLDLDYNMVYLQIWKTPHALLWTFRGYYVYDWLRVCHLSRN